MRPILISLATLHVLVVGWAVPLAAELGPCEQITAACKSAGFTPGGANTGGIPSGQGSETTAAPQGQIRCPTWPNCPIRVEGPSYVYVADSGGNSVTVYPINANGDVSPVAIIAGSKTGLSAPTPVSLDGSGRIYVGNYSDSILVFAAGASGNVSPVAIIAGSNTELYNPAGIAVDPSGNIYVANAFGGSITVYASGANGNVSPVAMIAGSKTSLCSPRGIALDGLGNIYVDDLCVNGQNPDSAGVLVFPRGANGNASPVATITGDKTGLCGSSGIAVDRAGTIYVGGCYGRLGAFSIQWLRGRRERQRKRHGHHSWHQNGAERRRWHCARWRGQHSS